MSPGNVLTAQLSSFRVAALVLQQRVSESPLLVALLLLMASEFVDYETLWLS
jgi:hypothetical protein